MARLTLYGDTETTRTWWTAWLCAKDGDAFRAVNPNGRVPALRDGDFVIWESMGLRQDSGIDLAALPDLTGWLRRCWSREHCPRRDQLLGELPPNRAP